MEDLEYLLPPDDFDELPATAKLCSIMERMKGMKDLEKMRYWRRIYATPEQYREEFPEDFSKNLSIAFHLLKKDYERYFDEINAVTNETFVTDESEQLFNILREIVEKDIENLLLGEVHEDEI